MRLVIDHSTIDAYETRVRALIFLPLHLGCLPHHLLLPDVAMPLRVDISQVNDVVPVNQPVNKTRRQLNCLYANKKI